MVIKPNLIEDPERTRQRAEQAVEEVKLVTVRIEKGEIIVKVGETIDQSAFILLDYFQLSRRRFNWLGFCGFGILVCCSIATFLWLEHNQSSGLRERDHLMVILLVLVANLNAEIQRINVKPNSKLPIQIAPRIPSIESIFK